MCSVRLPTYSNAHEDENDVYVKAKFERLPDVLMSPFHILPEFLK